MTTVLKETFLRLLSIYTDNSGLTNELWSEIEENYSGKKRFYHTLQHLDDLLIQLTEIKDELKDWEAILFTLYYHDIIYDAGRSDNEEESAALAGHRMKQVAVPEHIIEHCQKQILATKSHIQSSDSDTNYFTDADLSVLGQPWEIYLSYSHHIRREYDIYPDLIYMTGRKKVLHHFLEMDRIFKTGFFYNRYETQARQNMQKEIELL